MENSKETKERLIESARTEFSEKGYTKASLRKICSNAGVTTGALYFFFKDKEDLFAAIVEQPLSELKELIITHLSMEKDAYSSAAYEHTTGDHDDISAALIHHIYAHREEFLLLLTKSQGSRFENCVDEMVELTEKFYGSMVETMAWQFPEKRVDPVALHWFTHIIIDAFIRFVSHEPNEEKALTNLSRIMNFLVSGWSEMLLILADNE